jgi:hypothetical protein
MRVRVRRRALCMFSRVPKPPDREHKEPEVVPKKKRFHYINTLPLPRAEVRPFSTMLCVVSLVVACGQF